MFEISWRIDEKDWVQAAAIADHNPRHSYFDRRRLAFTTYSLYGFVQVSAGEANLYPREHFQRALDRRGYLARREAGRWVEWRPSAGDWPEIERAGKLLSLPDLAVQLASIHSRWEAVPDGGASWYQQSDDQGRVWFRKERGDVSIDANDVGSSRIVVSEAEFVSGVDAFLRDFARAVAERALGLLDWVTFEPLLPYAPPLFAARGKPPQGGPWRSWFELALPRPRPVRRTEPDALALYIQWDPRNVDWSAASATRGFNPPGSYVDTQLPLSGGVVQSPVRLLRFGDSLPTTDPWNQRDFGPATTDGGERETLFALPSPTVRGEAKASWPPASWPLLELGLQLARWLGDPGFLPPPAFTIEQSKRHGWDPREFLAFDDVVTYRTSIRPALFDDLSLLVGKENLENAARTFLTEFVSEVAERVPELLEWDSFRPLLRHL